MGVPGSTLGKTDAHSMGEFYKGSYGSDLEMGPVINILGCCRCIW